VAHVGEDERLAFVSLAPIEALARLVVREGVEGRPVEDIFEVFVAAPRSSTVGVLPAPPGPFPYPMLYYSIFV
jgi:hypothetical protein